MLAVAAAAASPRVVELTPDTFDATLADGNNWIVAFTAEWCGHCQKLKPKFDAAAKEAPEGTRFARVDGSRYRSLSTRYGIEGFPTMYYVSGGGSVVRRVHVHHTKEALLEYARGGWEREAPMSGLFSPAGPLKRAVFLAMRAGEKGACPA